MSEMHSRIIVAHTHPTKTYKFMLFSNTNVLLPKKSMTENEY